MRVNKNLLTLKCVMFTFFAGVGCLLPFLPLHMLAVGLTRDEARIVSVVAPCIAMLGPALAGPLADKLSVGRGASGGGSGGNNGGGSGRILRLMIAACFLLGAFFYLLLLAVPYSERQEVRRPSVNFTCHAGGAFVLQEVCSEDRTCNRWSGVKTGALVVDRCEYTCDQSAAAAAAATAAESGGAQPTGPPTTDEPSASSTWPTLPPGDYMPASLDGEYSFTDGEESRRERREEDEEEAGAPPTLLAPHLCQRSSAAPAEPGVCHVYTEGTSELRVDVALLPGPDNLTDDALWCAFPSAEQFRCSVPEEHAAELAARHNGSCVPAVRCRVLDPYDVPGGVLAHSPCQHIIGDPQATFWIYLILRSVADAFPTAALGLLGAACVVATRETSRGRGDVGRQLAVGSLGLALLPPLAGLAARDLAPPDHPAYLVPILLFAALMVVGALILLLDGNMPLSPPEWWWHTANGTLAMPMNTVRRYGAEIAGLFAVMVLLGILWSALDSYLPWTLKALSADDVDVGVTLAVGVLPAIPVLWWAETVVDYIGHSNLLITAFTIYAVRFTGMGLIEQHGWVLLLEALEVFTLSLVWVTAILYFRHLVPRKYTSTGQALPVIAHFGIGRCVGAVIGGIVVSPNAIASARDVYSGLAVTSLLIAAVYLALYHLVLAPSCAAPTTPPDQALLQGLNGNGASNGSYSPVRVYHEERGRKAQFRY